MKIASHPTGSKFETEESFRPTSAAGRSATTPPNPPNGFSPNGPSRPESRSSCSRPARIAATRAPNFTQTLSSRDRESFWRCIDRKCRAGRRRSWSPRYPEQRPGISYGRHPDGGWSYFTEPTPGAENADTQAMVAFLREPVFSVERGFFDEAFDLELFASRSGADIYYSLDGSAPDPQRGTLYDGPIRIEAPRAEESAWCGQRPTQKASCHPRVATKSYVFVDAVLDQPNRPEGFPRAGDHKRPTTPSTLG